MQRIWKAIKIVLRRSGEKIAEKTIYFFQYLGYLISVARKRPYFGIVYHTYQVRAERVPVMKRLIEAELKKHNGDFRVLEIGSWAGSSSVIWAKACQNAGHGKIFCVDTWAGTEEDMNIKERRKVLQKNRIHRIFLRNIRYSGLEKIIIPCIETSDEFMAHAKDDSFDFIYIDGNHHYTQCKKDIANAMRIIKPHGIICGDDLEIKASEVDEAEGKKFSEKDMILDPRTKVWYHPGVTFALHDLNLEPNILVENGIWWLRMTK